MTTKEDKLVMVLGNLRLRKSYDNKHFIGVLSADNKSWVEAEADENALRSIGMASPEVADALQFYYASLTWAEVKVEQDERNSLMVTLLHNQRVRRELR